ncbi:MAG: aspartate aminotransferase family protein [Dehalococcoidia bacterium]
MTTRDALRAEVEAEYRRMTPESAALYERAQAVLPGGDTRQSVFFRPYPLFVEGGEGAYVEDADGNRFLDCSNCWSAMILGHAHPAVVEAVSRQVARGTAFAAANRFAPELAELLAERVPSIEQLRFANSGTEATMFCVRAARAFTGRPKIVKMRGAYHGSHDDFTIAYGEAPSGIMPGTAAHVLEVEFNDKREISRTMEEHGAEVAAVIVEGIMGSTGMLPPEDGYLQHLREETARHGALLILDEVITLRLALGGAQDLYGVTPDLTAMGKIIGGGFPTGAFGGRRDLMQQFSPLGEHPITHSGTFNANPITLVAGLATMRELDADAIGYLNRLGDRFAVGVSRIAAEQDVPLQVTGAGSLRNVHFAEHPPHNGAESAATDKDLLRLLHLRLLTEGVLAAPRGMFAFSAVTTEAEVDRVLRTLDGTLRWLQPAIRTESPAPSA